MKVVTKIIKDIENFANKFQSCLLIEQQFFLTNFLLSATKFYGAPKAVLSKIIQEDIQTQKCEYSKI